MMYLFLIIILLTHKGGFCASKDKVDSAVHWPINYPAAVASTISTLTQSTTTPTLKNILDSKEANSRISKLIKRIEESDSKKKSSLAFPIAYPSSPPAEQGTSSLDGRHCDSDCICVPAYLCVDNQIVIDIGITIDNDLRHGSGWQCGNRYFVCCKVVPNPGTPPTIAPSTAIPGYIPRCGTLNPNGINARILGIKDAETQFGEYPWMAAVLEPKLFNGEQSYKFICGGALIWPSVVITAAHCVKGKEGNNLIIRLGEWDTQSTNEFYPHQDIASEEIIIHPQYYAGGLYYDVALIFLATSAILSPHIDTICLPEILPNYQNTSCWATGWGKDLFGKDGSYQVILKEVELPITSRPICQDALRRTNLGPNFNLHSSFLCAGGSKDLDTCVGDGGGGLVCASKTDPWRYVLAGLVSWGVGCGEHGVPGVYVDVSLVKSWIDLTITSKIPSYDLSRVTVLTDFKRHG